MAKKFVRGITDVKTITNQDFDTNNVNDLLSDGQYNYIHRKKGKTEEYHNLTDNIKTVSSDNTDLLTVTNNNKTTNTATLHPKHDKQKEQVIESTNETINISHGENGTDETTTVDTNPQKVLEHENLKTGDGLSVTHADTTSTINIKPTLNGDPLNNGFYMGNIIDDVIASSVISLQSESDRIVQLAFRESVLTPNLIVMKYRFVNNGVATDWKEATIDNKQLLSLLAQKEQVIESTRNTVTIQHGTNGTAEKTTVDTNPQKVLEHENLISDSEYITLDHKTGENVTHIKTAALKEELTNLHQTKQDTLTAGEGITIQGQTISASGTTSSIQEFFHPGEFSAFKHVVTIGQQTLTTFVFECYTNTAEHVITGELKVELENFINANTSISNGAITISYDGTNMKVINSAPSETNAQQGTFTFYDYVFPGGGEGGGDGGGSDNPM